jgi:hypothetical protein
MKFYMASSIEAPVYVEDFNLFGEYRTKTPAVKFY